MCALGHVVQACAPVINQEVCFCYCGETTSMWGADGNLGVEDRARLVSAQRNKTEDLEKDVTTQRSVTKGDDGSLERIKERKDEGIGTDLVKTSTTNSM